MSESQPPFEDGTLPENWKVKLVGVRQSSVRRASPDSLAADCDECERPMWIPEETLHQAAQFPEHRHHYICMDCLPPDIRVQIEKDQKDGNPHQ